MSRAARTALAGAVLLAGLASVPGCAPVRPPEALDELRRAIAGEPFAVARAEAPDLAAETERTLGLAEQAVSRRDRAEAERLASLAGIQSKTAFALARQAMAARRLAAARRTLAEAHEDLARYASESDDAEREISRLDELGAGTAASPCR